MLEVQLLGPVCVFWAGGQIGLARKLERALLARLALDPGRPLTGSRLVNDLWGEGDGGPRDPVASLQNLVYRLRGTLGAAGGILESAPGGYRLAVSDRQVDVGRFEDLVRATATTVDPAETRRTLVEALGLWRGPPLADVEGVPFVAAQASRLDSARLEALEARIDADLAAGEEAALISELERLVGEERYRERLWGQLMLAHYRCGSQALALRAATRLRAMLVEELGLEPGPTIRALEDAILRQDPALSRSAVRSGTSAGGPPGDVQGQAPSPKKSVGGDIAGALPHRSHGAAEPTVRRTATFLLAEMEVLVAPGDLPASAIDAVRRQECVLVDAVAAKGGTVVNHTGEGLSAVFDNASDGLGAALQVQRSLVAEGADDRYGLSPRMAVHTGDVDGRDGRFYGSTLRRAARLCQAAHPGQLLVSAATEAVARASLPDDADLVDLGRWSFPDLDRPERVYQLCHPDLSALFPRLRLGHPAAGTLPITGTTFVDRDLEREAIAAHFRQGVLVTLTGEGGIGKTRLALEVAATHTNEFADGVWFCDLSTVADADEIVGRLAATLGVGESPGRDLRSVLVSFLRFAHLMVVVDNCEHFSGPVADLIDSIVTVSPAVKVLATSRTPLGVRGERVVRLRPLRVPEPGAPVDDCDAPALRLLCDRALAAGAKLDRRDPALAEVARGVDGLPLAIELAARRLTSMAPRELSARLAHHRLDLLGTPVAGHPHQATLRATLDWSYELLAPPNGVLFRALSVCAGGWTLDAAESLAPHIGLRAQDAGGILGDLTDSSLVGHEESRHGNARYSMLATIREYAAERLDDDGAGATVAAWHAEYVATLVERAARESRGPHEGTWVGRVSDEFDNVRAAVGWCVRSRSWDTALRLLPALVDEFVLRERLEIGRWALDILAATSGGEHAVRGVALAIAGNLALVEGRTRDADSLSRQALAAEEAHGATRFWLARNTLALLSAAGLCADDAEAYLAAMAELSEAVADPMALAVSLFDRALITSLGEQPEDGLCPAEQLLELGRAHGNSSITAMGLLSVGRALSRIDPDGALAALNESLDLAVSVHGSLLAQQARRAMIEIDARGGDLTKSLAVLRELLVDFERTGDLTQQLQTVLAALDSLVALGAFELVATICGSMAQTPAAATAPYRVAKDLAGRQLPAEVYVAAYTKGVFTQPVDLPQLIIDQVAELLFAPEG